jgi:hypothetical protein
VLINLRVPVISEISLIAPKAEGCLKWAGMNGFDGSSGVMLVTMSSPRLGGAVNCGGAGLDFWGTRSVVRTGERGRIAGVEAGVIVCVPIVPYPLRSMLSPEPQLLGTLLTRPRGGLAGLNVGAAVEGPTVY